MKLPRIWRTSEHTVISVNISPRDPAMVWPSGSGSLAGCDPKAEALADRRRPGTCEGNEAGSTCFLHAAPLVWPSRCARPVDANAAAWKPSLELSMKGTTMSGPRGPARTRLLQRRRGRWRERQQGASRTRREPRGRTWRSHPGPGPGGPRQLTAGPKTSPAGAFSVVAVPSRNADGAVTPLAPS